MYRLEERYDINMNFKMKLLAKKKFEIHMRIIVKHLCIILSTVLAFRLCYAIKLHFKIPRPFIAEYIE